MLLICLETLFLLNCTALGGAVPLKYVFQMNEGLCIGIKHNYPKTSSWHETGYVLFIYFMKVWY